MKSLSKQISFLFFTLCLFFLTEGYSQMVVKIYPSGSQTFIKYEGSLTLPSGIPMVDYWPDRISVLGPHTRQSSEHPWASSFQVNWGVTEVYRIEQFAPTFSNTQYYMHSSHMPREDFGWHDNFIRVRQGYSSGSPISEIAVFDENYNSLDLIAGTYWITWDGGSKGSSRSIKIIVSPEPSSGNNNNNPGNDTPTLPEEPKVEPIITQAVYRFIRLNCGSHFFTANEAEKDIILTQFPSDIWQLEGTVFEVLMNPREDALPVYRLYNSANGAHFYTISEEEKDYVLEYMPSFSAEGVAFYAYATQVEGSLPVCRFFNLLTGSHFFTISETERDGIIATMSGVLAYEGIAFYAYPIDWN